jgi:putative membrane protein, TIGR04086 family/integral membrane protein, TIGR04097 family
MQKSEEGRSALVDTWQGIAFGAFIGLLLTLLVLCILALLIYSENISEGFGDVFVFISALSGSCVGAVVTIKRRQGRGALTVGFVGGTAYFFLVLLSGVFGGYEDIIWSKILKIGICAIMGGLLGGTLCLPVRKRKNIRKVK